LIALIDEMGWYGMRKNGFPPLYVSTATWHRSEGAHSSVEQIDGSIIISTVSRAWHLALEEEDNILYADRGEDGMAC
jgi:hypothetical protein